MLRKTKKKKSHSHLRASFLKQSYCIPLFTLLCCRQRHKRNRYTFVVHAKIFTNPLSSATTHATKKSKEKWEHFFKSTIFIREKKVNSSRQYNKISAFERDTRLPFRTLWNPFLIRTRHMWQISSDIKMKSVPIPVTTYISMFYSWLNVLRPSFISSSRIEQEKQILRIYHLFSSGSKLLVYGIRLCPNVKLNFHIFFLNTFNLSINM